jgi:7-carboxy-7-deazaguanine synthase
MSGETLRISEIFGPTIQGEGALIGMATVFVRTGGCDFRCSWCDTLHAVDSAYRETWTPMSADAVMDEVRRLSGGEPLMITVSGGNPAIQPLGRLIELGKREGYRFALETQGSLSRDWFASLDVLSLSPKPPSSGMAFDRKALADAIAAAGPGTAVALKFVVFDEADYGFAREVSGAYPHLPVYLQPGNHTPPPADQEDAVIDIPGIMARLRWLIDRAANDRWFQASILPQLHTLIWGNLRGV